MQVAIGVELMERTGETLLAGGEFGGGQVPVKIDLRAGIELKPSHLP